MGKQEHSEQKRKHARKWPWVLGGVLVLLVLIVLLVPVILSSGGFTRWLQGQISQSTGGEADIGDLSVGWLHGVRVADFQFRAQNGWANIDIDRITAHPKFSSLLSGNLALDRTVIDQPQVRIDLRDRPAPETDEPARVDMEQIQRLNNLFVRDGTVHLTDTAGQTVQISDLNSDVSVRKPGRASRLKLDMVVAQANRPAQVRVDGQVTPDKQQGWSLKGTSGDLVVEVNDLDLDSVAPLLSMAGIQVQAQGQVSADLQSEIEDGRIENVNATVRGQRLHLTGEALKGNRLATSQLNVRANLTQSDEVLSFDELEVQTDWASISATGRVPKTPQSLEKLLESGTAYDLKGQFDVNLAALLSQMPNLIRVREGMEITGGRATGTVNTTTQDGRATIVAEAEVAGLAGTVDGEKVALSEPMQTTLRLSADEEGAELERLSLTTPFATVNASGDFEQIRYEVQATLAALQSELGPFVDLGSYALEGQVQSTGQISIGEQDVAAVGSLSARQLVIAGPDGNSVSEPSADMDFSLSLDRKSQVIAVEQLTATAGFGNIAVRQATIPLAGSETPLNVRLAADNVELGRLKPYLTFFALLPQELTLGGIAQSQVVVTQEDETYRISLESAQIQDFQVTSPEQEPFRQERVTARFDAYVNPVDKTINIERLQLESPQIKVRKGQFGRAIEGNTAKTHGEITAEWDWAAVSSLASPFVPGTLDVAGQRQATVQFNSTYSTGDPNGLLANLNGTASLGFDRAAYQGLNFGPTDIDIRIDDGRMQIEPFSTTVNEGQFRFAGQADLGQRPILLQTSERLQMAEGIRITQEMTGNLLKFVNPIFVGAVDVNGVLSFDAESMVLPLTGGFADRAEIRGTVAIPQIRMEATLLNRILAVIKESLRDQIIEITPTKITLDNGAIRYEDMEIIVGDNPVNFGGTIGLNESLDMTVVLPYTYEGKTARVGEPTAQKDKRIVLPLTGKLTAPKLNLQRLLEEQLKGQFREQIRRGIEKLFD